MGLEAFLLFFFVRSFRLTDEFIEFFFGEGAIIFPEESVQADDEE